jgi:tetratricopeptide (TPR) repeat protein
MPLLLASLIAALATGCGQIDPRWSESSLRQPKPKKDHPVIEALREETKANPRSAEAHTRLGFRLLEMERYREAEDCFYAALRIEPNLISARLGLWQIYYRLTDPYNTVILAVTVTRESSSAVGLKEAVKAFDRALVARPDDSGLLYFAAVAHAKLGDWTEAQQSAYRASVGLHAPPHLVYADVLLQVGQVDSAATELQKIAAPDAVTFDTIGRVQEARGNYEAALRAYERAAEMRPDWHVPLVRAGFLCLRQKRFDLAAVFFARAEKISPTDSGVQSALAELKMVQGDDAGAIAIYEKMLELEPDSSFVLNNLAHLLSKKSDQLPRALELARRAEAADPRNAAAKSTLGWILHLQGHHEEALPYLRAAVRAMPDLGTVHYRLGKILLALNRGGDAQTALRGAIERGLPADELKDAERLLAAP